MSARQFVGYVEAYLVEHHGGETVDEWLDEVPTNDLAIRRQRNVLAALELGAEVG